MSRQLLRLVLANAPLARMLLAFGAFTISNYARWLAIIVYAYGRGGAAEAGIVSLLMYVPAALVAPFAASLGDRTSRSMMLLASYLAQALAVAATALAVLIDAPSVGVYLAATAASMATSLTRPAHMSLAPGVTRTPEELTASNVVTSWMDGIGGLVGPAFAGIVLNLSGPGAIFALAAALMTAAAAVVLHLAVSLAPAGAPPPPRSAGAPGRPSRAVTDEVGSSVLGGFIALRRRPGPLLLVLMIAAGSALGGAIDVLYVSLSLGQLRLDAAGVGTLGAALGIGRLVGSTASSAFVGRRRIGGSLGISLLLAGLPLIALATFPSFLSAFAVLVACGAGISLLNVAALTLLQRAAPERVLSRILGIVEAGFLAAFGIGSAVVGSLIVTIGPLVSLFVAGLSMPAIAAIAWRRLVRIDGSADLPEAALAALARLRSVPMFAPLSPPVLERLARNLRPLTFPDGASIIQEGEPGTAFYVIDTGRVDFTVGGRPAGTAGPGDSFGEIALLRHGIRTASAIADGPTTVLVLGRRDFLEALTGSASARRVADAMVDARLGG
jgi:CRP-like cAMP-binding protein